MPSAWTASEKKISNMEASVFMGVYLWFVYVREHLIGKERGREQGPPQAGAAGV